MRGNGQRAPELVVTPDGWVTTSLTGFRFIADHSPPRPYGYLSQLWVDARSWKPLAMWAVGGGAVGLAATGQWYLIPFGVFGLLTLASYLWMLLRTVRMYRWSPLVAGVIDTLAPHPLVGYCATARARLADGREVAVVLIARMAAEIIWERGRAEVLFLHDTKSQYSRSSAPGPCPYLHLPREPRRPAKKMPPNTSLHLHHTPCPCRRVFR